MEDSKFFKVCFALALALGASNVLAVDACNESAGHSGRGTKAPDSNGSTIIEKATSTDYSYTWWYNAGDNAMTYYEDGSFSVQWAGNAADGTFLGGVGLSFDSLQSYKDVGQLDADFNFTKSGSVDDYAYIGVFGMSASLTREFLIIEDWFVEPNAGYLGEKKGEISVDGATYDIYFSTVNRIDKLGQGNLQRVFSVRRSARQCGHIDISAHFKKWEELGFNVSPLAYVWLYAEGSSDWESGSVDFTYAKVSQSPSADTSKSSNSSNSGSGQGIQGPVRDSAGTTVVYSVGGTNGGPIGNSGYHYEVWSNKDGGSITYYDDGSFTAEWDNLDDFLAGAGLLYDSDKTYKEFEPFSADFEFTKSGAAGYSFIGVHGWTKNPLVEYYVVEDQFTRSDWPKLGKKQGEFTVDGDIYDVYTMYYVPSVYDTQAYWVVYSVRRNFRQSGHVDISAHFEKWKELGVALGGIYDVKLAAMTGGAGAGSVAYTTVKVTEGSYAPSSDSTFEEFSTTKLASPVKLISTEGPFRVFDMQGHFLGSVEFPKGMDVSDVLKARFGKAGIYFIKNGNFSQKVSVNK